MRKPKLVSDSKSDIDSKNAGLSQTCNQYVEIVVSGTGTAADKTTRDSGRGVPSYNHPCKDDPYYDVGMRHGHDSGITQAAVVGIAATRAVAAEAETAQMCQGRRNRRDCTSSRGRS